MGVGGMTALAPLMVMDELVIIMIVVVVTFAFLPFARMVGIRIYRDAGLVILIRMRMTRLICDFASHLKRSWFLKNLAELR
ncbi:MAG: hypothetical protein BGO39_02505 [Chloroflexi bacterium 54-19]|nr:MAG: hypothetical protein BGO39_02505 [Chloroflexi bacterium 54-19]